MGRALYRKYRSKGFDEVIGQDHIIDTLKRSIKNQRISHAYLFTGPRGVGKTSVARILAHEVNGISYEDESVHLDIIEIDAASNRRIDEIRDLRDKVHIAPTSSKYKVYIIDEVHMLTREAFNALLKTLEEPPKHCIFILATTEAHKLPDTIISRTQRFEFKPITTSVAVKHLNEIAKKEAIDIDQEALTILADHGEGSIRDSISLLDQLSSYGNKITTETVEKFLGLPPKQTILSLLRAIDEGDAKSVIDLLNQLKEKGATSVLISSALSRAARESYIHNFSKSWLPEFIKALLSTPVKPDPEPYLEILLLETAINNQVHSSAEPESASDNSVQTQSSLPESEPEEPTADIEPAPEKISKPDAKLADLNGEGWEIVVEKSKAKAASIYTALRLASPEFSADKVILKFKFPLHQKKINQAKYKKLISDLIEETTGNKVVIQAIVDKNAEAPAKNILKTADINAISNIFPEAEMLES